jgi:hypothetical protein
MAGTPGISAFNLPGSIGPFGGITYSMGNFNLPAGFPTTFGPGPAPSIGSRGKPAPGRSYAPFDVTNPFIQAYGIQSPFNPMMAFDLMSMGSGPFQSPFAGSGLLGYPPASYGPKVSSVPVLGGKVAAGQAPVPSSGGKGMLQGY